MRETRGADIVLLALSMATLLALSVHKIVNLDVWWQLETGKLVLESGWPTLDPYSYGEPGRVWTEMRWLYCVAAFTIFKALGLNYLIVAKTLVLAAVAALLIRLRRAAPLWIGAAGITLFSLMAHPRFLVRPEILTFLFLALFLDRLDREGSGLTTRSIATLAAVQLLWANSHSTFLIGPAVLWIFAFGVGVRLLAQGTPGRAVVGHLKRLFVAAGLTTAVCLVNPYHLEGFLFPIRLLTQIRGDHPLNLIIQEFASPLTLGVSSTAFLILAVGGTLAAISFLLRPTRAEIPWWLLWSTFLGLAVMAQRNVALFGLVSAVVLVRNLRQVAETSSSRLAMCSRVAILLFGLVALPAVVTDAYPIRFGRPERFGVGVVSYRYPFQALDFVRRNDLPLPVIGKLGDGGAFLFDGGPRSTLIDGRLEVYSADFIRRYRQALGSPEVWDAVTAEFGIRTAVLNHPETTVTIDFLERHEDWRAIYLDPRFVVYSMIDDNWPATRIPSLAWATWEPAPPGTPSRLATEDWFAGWPLRLPDPVPDRDLGRFFLARGELDRSRTYFRQAFEAAPGMTQTRIVLALLERALGGESEAVALLTPTPPERVQTPSMLALQAQLYEVAKQPAKALTAYENALAAGGRDFGSVIRIAVSTGRPERARHALQRAADQGASDPELFNALGLLYVRSGEIASAVQAFETSLHLDPEQPGVLNQMGILSAQGGRLDEAQAFFEQVLTLEPANEAARGNLLRLRRLRQSGNPQRPPTDRTEPER